MESGQPLNGRDRDPPQQSNWVRSAPWFLTISCTLILISIAVFLVWNIVWFNSQATANVPATMFAYRTHVYHMHLSMVKRSVGLFSGFSLLFIGMAVSFYYLRSANRVTISGPGIAAEAISASPGIIATVMGVVLLLGVIASKDSFASYVGEFDIYGELSHRMEWPSPEPRQSLPANQEEESNVE